MKVIRLKNETTGEEKDIQIPDGFEYDKIITHNKGFRDCDGSYEIHGFYLAQGNANELDEYTCNYACNKDIFVTKELAESALALAQLSQIIEHNGYLKSLLINKSKIYEYNEKDIVIITYYHLDDCITYSYLNNYETLHKAIKQMNVITYILNSNYLVFRINNNCDCDKIKDFIKENEDLIRKYLMV